MCRLFEILGRAKLCRSFQTIIHHTKIDLKVSHQLASTTTMVLTPQKKPAAVLELDDYQIKQLLQDVEESNQLRNAVNLLLICNTYPRLYGEKGTEKRRAYQFKWHYYKKMKIHKYVDLLDTFGVTPSESTQNSFRTTPREEDDEDRDDNPVFGVGVPVFEEDNAIEKAAARIAGLSMDDDEEESLEDDDDDATSVSTSMMKTPPPVARRRVVGTSQTPDRRLLRSPPPIIAHSNPNPNGDDIEIYIGKGTKAAPHVVMVDCNMAERNLIFDIERGTIVHNKHEYVGYTIRTSVAPPDFKIWEAFVPSVLPRKFRSFGKRAMLVKAPSRSAWLSDVEMYHSFLGKQNKACAETKRRHTNTSLAIEKDPDRAFSYYLLLWTTGVVLDNQILSNHPTEVEKHLVPMNIDAATNEFGKTLYGMAVTWRIAEKYGGTQVEDNKTAINTSTLFD
jgi:hypothetical protein